MKRCNCLLPTMTLILGLFSGSQALAQITWVKAIGTNSSKTTGTSIAVTVPAGGVAAGNSLIVSLAMDPASGTVSCTDSAKNSYAVDRDQINGSGTSGLRTVILSAHNVNALVSGNSITCTHPSVAARALSASEFSGLAVSGTKDQTTSATGQSTAPSSGSTGTTTQATELLIGAIGVEGPSGDTFTPGTSYTTTGRGGTTGGNAATNITINPEYRIVTATGAYAATGTLSNSRKWAAAIVTYKAALPTKLVIVSVNGGANPTAGPPGFSVTVQSQNANNNPTAVGSATGVSLTLKTGTGTLGGTLSGTIAAGTSQAVISGVTYTKAENGVVITATRTSGDTLTPGDSAPFTVNPGSPSALAFVTQPGNSPLSGSLTGPPTVAVVDSSGNPITSSTALITVTLPTPSYTVLTGTTSKNATAGIASFNDLMVSPIGNGYALVASSSGFSNVTSSTFNITAATGTISGTVSRADNAAPINGALIEAFQAGVSMGTVSSASNGTYFLSGLPTGLYELRASAVDNIAQPKSGVTVTLGSSSTANFSLTQEKIVYVYDTLSRLRAVIDIAGQTATYAYDAVGNLLGISRYNSSQTSVIEFTPTKGLVGTTVTIYGTGFSLTPSQNTVTFNGASATVISSAATQLVATVPSGATSGPIDITAPSGSASSAASFTVTLSSGIPTVANFTPTIGTVSTPVTVTGTNFDTTPSKNDLRFNNARGAVSSSTVTSIATTVPSGAGSGRISVTTVFGKGTSSADFFVPPSPYAVADIEFTGRLLTNGTPLNVGISTSNKKGLVLFDGTAGERMSLRISNSTYPFLCPTCDDVNLQFYRPDGTPWVGTHWANTNAHFFEPPALPTSGTYTILVNPTGTGQATFELFDGTIVDLGSINFGVPVAVSVPVPGQNPQLSFTGIAGQRISLNITNANFPLPCPWCQDAYVYIYKPDGQILTQGTWANGTGTFIDLQTLPISGSYRVVLDPQGGSTGHATLTLYNLAPEDQGPITFGAPVTAVTTLPGQNVSYTFNGTVGQQVSLTVSNTTFPLACPWCWAASVQIVKPDNSTLVLRGWDILSFVFVDTVTLPDAGVYKVLLDPAGAGTGQAQLTLYNVPSEAQGSISVNGPPANLSLSVPGQNAKLTFSGTQNDMVMARVTNNTLAWTDVTVLRQDGTTVLASISTGQSSFNLAPVVLPASETYSVKVDPAGASTGNASVSVCGIPIATAPTLPGTDTIWVEDGIPAGANPAGTWNWDTIQKASGTQSHWNAPATGTHQHYFDSATSGLALNTGDKLFAYVLIDPCAPPQEVMLQWNENGTWEHRAYWGADLIGFGTSGTASRFPMGALPATGQWVRLEVPAPSVGLEGKVVKGMAFTLYDGHAWFDRAGKFQ